MLATSFSSFESFSITHLLVWPYSKAFQAHITLKIRKAAVWRGYCPPRHSTHCEASCDEYNHRYCPPGHPTQFENLVS